PALSTAALHDALPIFPSRGTGLQVRNSSVAYVDEDQSPLSRRIINSIQMPFFQTPRAITYHDINQVLDRAEYIFVLHIPSGFQKDRKSTRLNSSHVKI